MQFSPVLLCRLRSKQRSLAALSARTHARNKTDAGRRAQRLRLAKRTIRSALQLDCLAARLRCDSEKSALSGSQSGAAMQLAAFCPSAEHQATAVLFRSGALR